MGAMSSKIEQQYILAMAHCPKCSEPHWFVIDPLYHSDKSDGTLSLGEFIKKNNIQL